MRDRESKESGDHEVDDLRSEWGEILEQLHRTFGENPSKTNHSHPWLDCLREDPESMFDPNVFREGPGFFESLESVLRGKKSWALELLGSGFPELPSPKSISSVEELEKAMKDEASKLAVCFKDLPSRIQEAHNKFIPIFKSGKFVSLDESSPSQLTTDLFYSLNFSTDKRGGLRAIATLSGVYINVTTYIDNDEIAGHWIPMAVALKNSIEELQAGQKRREFANGIILSTKRFCNSLLDMRLRSLCIPEFQGPGKRNLVVERNKEYENGKGFESEFVLLFDGEILTNKVLGRSEGTAIWELQKELARQDEILKKEKSQYAETNIEIAVAQDKLNECLAVIRNYCALTAQTDCEPVAVAVDEDDLSCIIIEVSIEEELPEVPSFLKRSVVEKHLTGESPLSEEHQKALGVLEKISKIEANNAVNKDFMNRL